ncbi:MAG TPA: hypothetical protein VN807_06460, partial [Candidatus Sulfotelmatobacter sp.]|nr:hypothetical protein [Candidatus Sulfotelmatobacter sp.]
SLTTDEYEELCLFLGLQACRHPDIFGRGFRRVRELAKVIASVHEYSNPADYVAELHKFGLSHIEGMATHKIASTKTSEQLRVEFVEAEGLSPQDPKLPIQDAMRAFGLIGNVVRSLSLTILDAPAATNFVLGDTPMPQNELALGFTIPTSKSVALCFAPVAIAGVAPFRRAASPAEVRASNVTQWRDARKVVVGPDPAALRAFN